MKKIYLLLLFIASRPLFPQIQLSAIDYLDTNNVKAAIICNADFGWDFANSQYEVPKGSGKHPLFNGSLWIGGYNNGILHMAANTYRQAGLDFWPGPLDTATASINLATSNQWNKLWRISLEEVEMFKLQWALGNVQNGSYTPTPNVLNWPGNGGPGNLPYIGMFFDLNADGFYNPVPDGDYPIMKGDEMFFWVINDALAPHGETGAPAMGIEIHCEAYAYHRPCMSGFREVLENTTFYNYRIFNLSNNFYDSTFIGFFLDPDLGNPFDDYVGCDVRTNSAFTYNANPIDGVYGAKPPAFSLVTLKGPDADLNDALDNNRDSCIDCSWPVGGNCEPCYTCAPIADELKPESILMSNFNYIDNTTPPLTNYYKLMNSRQSNGNYMTYGGNGTVATNPPTNFVFPGTSDPNGWGLGYQPGNPPTIPPFIPWTEHDLSRPAGDRRMIVSMGKFTFKPKTFQDVEMALVFSRDTINCANNLCAINKAHDDADSLQQWYDCYAWQSISCNPVNGIQELSSANIGIYPNPVNDHLIVTTLYDQKLDGYEILDMLGRSVRKGDLSSSFSKHRIEVSGFPSGIYFLKVAFEGKTAIKKFVKE